MHYTINLQDISFIDAYSSIDYGKILLAKVFLEVVGLDSLLIEVEV